MHPTRHRSVFGSVALTAALVAAAPVEPVPTNPERLSVALAAAADPVTAWMDVLATSADNLGALASSLMARRLPALTQFLDNLGGYAATTATALQGGTGELLGYLTQRWPAGLTDIVGDLTSGHLDQGFTALADLLVGTVTDPVAHLDPVMAIPATMAQNLANVVAALADLTDPYVTVAALGPVHSVAAALGDTAHTVVDAVGQGDPLTALGGLVNLPAAVTGALLNGGVADAGGGHFWPGLLSIGSFPIDNGLLSVLTSTVPMAVATALGWQPWASATAELPQMFAVTQIPLAIENLVTAVLGTL